MENRTSKEAEYVDKLLSKMNLAATALMGGRASEVGGAAISGYQEGIAYAIKTFLEVYKIPLGGEK